MLPRAARIRRRSVPGKNVTSAILVIGGNEKSINRSVGLAGCEILCAQSRAISVRGDGVAKRLSERAQPRLVISPKG